MVFMWLHHTSRACYKIPPDAKTCQSVASRVGVRCIEFTSEYMSETTMYSMYEAIHTQLTFILRENSKYRLVCLGVRRRKVNRRV